MIIGKNLKQTNYNEITVKEDKWYKVKYKTYIDVRDDALHLNPRDNGNFEWDEVEDKYYYAIREHFDKCLDNKIWEEGDLNSRMDAYSFSYIITFTLSGIYAYCKEDVYSKVETWFKEHENQFGKKYSMEVKTKEEIFCPTSI